MSTEGPSTRWGLWIVIVICLTTLPAGLLMTRLPPGQVWWARPDRRWHAGAWFVLYADLGVGGTLFTLADPEMALYGSTLFAIISVYAGHFLSPRLAVGHIAITSAIIVVLTAQTWHHDEHDTPSVLVRGLISLLVANVALLLVSEFTADIQQALKTQLAHATRDPLTGLANRRGLDKIATRMLTQDPRVGFIVVDVDDFKSVNDVHGHAAGDAVLIRLGARLRALAGPSVVVARTGGEEFTLAAHAHDLKGLAHRLRVNAHNGTDDIPITVSIGVATHRPHHGPLPRARNPKDLIASTIAIADGAMYQAKATGRNRVVTRTVYLRPNHDPHIDRTPELLRSPPPHRL
jgi:two-component system cell cycle response regulator